MAVRLSALCPQKYLLVLIFVNPRAVVRLEGSDKLKKFNDLMGTLTRDLLACSIVPLPSTLPRAPTNFNGFIEDKGVGSLNFVNKWKWQRQICNPIN
jgi:hypothetical protein